MIQKTNAPGGSGSKPISRREAGRVLGRTGLALAAGAALAPAAEAAPPKPQNIVVHLSSSEGEHALHSAFMGIGLAGALRRMGADVTLMLDSSGPNLAKQAWSSKRLPAASAMPSMPALSLGEALTQLAQAGGRIRLCPHCSRVCGVEPGETVPGAQLAAEGELAAIVFHADKILDY